MAPADQLVEMLLRQIIVQKSLARGSWVALLVNNLGGTPAMELAVVARHTLAVLEAEGIVVERAWAGTFLTAIEMAGCSISLLALDDERLKWLDAAATAPAWVAGQAPGPVQRQGVQVPVESTSGTASPIFEAVLRAICAALTEAEPKLTAMDQAVGDGDLGISLARGAAAILAEMPGYDLARPPEALKAMSATLRRALGGTSGPLYAVFLLRAARTLEGAGTADAAAWAEAFAQGAAAIGQLGDARPGDRTMLDAMVPAAEALKAALLSGLDLDTSLKRSVAAAQEGTAATADMSPRRGRSSYLGNRVAGKPDPGAEAVAIWLAAASREGAKSWS
jgi:dihydroxyacetone kinase